MSKADAGSFWYSYLGSGEEAYDDTCDYWGAHTLTLTFDSAHTASLPDPGR